MAQALPQSTSHKNVRIVLDTPNVKSAKTCKLFNTGVSEIARNGKSTDPTCYNASRSMLTGLFDNVERDMTDTKPVPLWNKGDDVNVFQCSFSKGLLFEGRAKIVKAFGGWDEHYMVRFYNKKTGKLEREAYERFIDRDGQANPDAYVIEFNKRIGYVT